MNYEFYDLPRVLQDRFVESSRGAAVPVALGFAEKKDFKSLFWLLTALLVAGAWAVFTLFGFGELNNRAALGSLPFFSVHLALGILFFTLLFKSYGSMWSKEQRPLKNGSYLFPACILTLQAGAISEYSLVNAQLKANGKRLSIRCQTGESFQFKVETDASLVQTQIEESSVSWQNSSKEDPLTQARLHPLIDSGIPNPLAPTQPLALPQLAPLLVVLGAILVLGSLSAVGVYSYRNIQSERIIYRIAVEENTVESYRAYLERGGSRPEVASLYLPRAELSRAREEGTVAAIEEFLEKNAESEIIDEVRAFHRQALLDELEKAKAKNTVAALDELPKRFRAAQLIANELRVARHAIYVQAFEQFSLRAASQDKPSLKAVQSLLDYSEKHGPQVLVRIRQVFTQDRDNLDRIVMKSRKYYLGRRSLPTQYFVGGKTRVYEKLLAENIINSLQKEFSPELLQFKLDPLPEKENQEWAQATLPTLSITHSEKLSGGYVGGKPKGVYLGASVRFKSTLEVPGVEGSLKDFSWNVWRHPDFRILEEKGTSFPQVYDSMMTGAFERFTKKYLATWLKDSN